MNYAMASFFANVSSPEGEGGKKKGILCERTVKLLSELMDMNQK